MEVGQRGLKGSRVGGGRVVDRGTLAEASGRKSERQTASRQPGTFFDLIINSGLDVDVAPAPCVREGSLRK